MRKCKLIIEKIIASFIPVSYTHLKTRLKDELQYMQQNNLDIVGTFIEIIDEKGVVQKETMRFPVTAAHVKLFMRWGSCLAHPTWMVKLKVYQELNGYRNVPRCEDYDFILRAMAHGYKVGNIPKVELSYRIRQSGISKSNEAEQFLMRDYLAPVSYTHLIKK